MKLYIREKLEEKFNEFLEFLSGTAFTKFVTGWMIAISMLMRLIVIPASFLLPLLLTYTPKEHEIMILFFGYMFFGSYSIIASIVVSIYADGNRYKNRANVQEEFQWSNSLKEARAYFFMVDVVIHLIFPSAYTFIKIWFLPQAVLGFILVSMDLLGLYNYYHCDFLQFIKNREDLEIYKCYEEAYEPKNITIVESTPTYVTIRNCGDQDLAMDFYIKREVKNNSTQDFKVFFSFKYDGRVPSGTNLRIETTECKVPFNNNDLAFTMTNIRSFGPNAGDKVTTTIYIPGSRDLFNVRMEELYETEEGRKKREKEEAEAAAAKNVDIRRPVKVEKEIPRKTLEEA